MGRKNWVVPIREHGTPYIPGFFARMATRSDLSAQASAKALKFKKFPEFDRTRTRERLFLHSWFFAGMIACSGFSFQVSTRTRPCQGYHEPDTRFPLHHAVICESSDLGRLIGLEGVTVSL